jgi:3-oxoadipate enol-lactonase
MARTTIGWMFTVPSTAGVPEPETLALPGRGQTAVTDIGPRDAPVLVLLHAVACTGLLTWYPTLRRLTERYRVVVFDQRWHGRGIRSPEFSLADCADDVIAVADVLGLNRFTIAGYSMGGMVGQLVAHARPDRVRGLVLCSTASNIRRGVRQRIALDVFGRGVRRLREQARTGMEQPARTRLAHLNDRRWALAEFRATSPWAIGAAIDEIGRFDSTGWLFRLRLPTSVIVTAKDGVIAPDHQRSLGRRIPGAATYEIPAGHAACVLRAEVFVPALLAACASVHAR